jgi:hypothetical protein
MEENGHVGSLLQTWLFAGLPGFLLPLSSRKSNSVVYTYKKFRAQKHLLQYNQVKHDIHDEMMKLLLFPYDIDGIRQLSGFCFLCHSRPQHVNHMLAYPSQSSIPIVHNILRPRKQQSQTP